MKVADVMTRRVIAVAPETGIRAAIHLMLKHHVSGLPVIDNHATLIGIVTEGDFLRRVELGTEQKRSSWLDALFGPAEGAEAYVQAHGVCVGNVMTPKPLTVAEQTSLGEVVRIMEGNKIKRLPVVRDGKIVGIVSRANLMKALLGIHKMMDQAPTDDEAIRERILTDIETQRWSAGAEVDAVVRGGIVDLWGTITDASQRNAFRVLAESVPGVIRVEDHLTWNGEAAKS